MATQENLNLAQQLYVAYYGRPADAAGLQFWAEEIEANSIESVVSAFGNSAEYTERFSGLDNEALVNGIYQQAFGRDAEAEGLEFWTGKLESGELDLATIALAIVEGASDSDAPDATTLANKVVAADLYTAAAGEAHSGTAADEYAAGILAGVNADTDVSGIDPSDWVAGIPSEGGEPEVGGEIDTSGEIFSHTANADTVDGTDLDDTFVAPITTINFTNGNTLNTGDVLDGGEGVDTLKADLINDAFVTGGAGAVRPTTESIENVEINALDTIDEKEVYFNASRMTDVEHLGSYNSNSHLVVQDITTLDAAGNKRATSELTFRMDHTSNANSSGVASDLVVYFDENYLVPRTEFGVSSVVFKMMNQDSYDQNGGELRLDGVFVRRMEFALDGERYDLAQYIEEDPMGYGDEFRTERELVGYLNETALPALVADNSDNAEALSSLSFTIGNVWNDGNQNRLGEEIVLTASNEYTLETRDAWLTIDQAENVASSYASNRIERADRQEGPNDEIISTNIELHKVGRGSEGGDVKVGGKSQSVNSDGIPVFNVDVLGGSEKPSNVGWIGTTNDDLEEVTIVTHEDYVGGNNFASLTIREGFGTDEEGAHTEMSNVDADGFLGDLTVGGFHTDNAETAEAFRAYNVDTFSATGGGDVTYWHESEAAVDPTNEAGAYSITTGAGNDTINVTGTGTYTIATGSGRDTIILSEEDTSSTIVFAEGNSGRKSIQNFTTTDDGTNGADILDFTAWLDGMDGNSLDSNRLETTLVENGVFTANSVVLTNFATLDTANTVNLSFGDMTDSQVLSALNGDGTYSVSRDADLSGGEQNSIMMVENPAGNGLFKLYEVTADNANGNSEFNSASLIGSVNFGEEQTFTIDNIA
ncbi:DUF4214 domain-containing protein [Halomonas sp. CH40]